MKSFAYNFLGLMFTVFLMFTLTVLLGDKIADLFIMMNEKGQEFELMNQVYFWVGAFIFTGIWCFLWMHFKRFEKKCVDNS